MNYFATLCRYSPLFLAMTATGVRAMNCSGEANITCSEQNFTANTAYTKYNYDGDLSLSFTDSRISAPGMAINESVGSGEASFFADELIASDGGIMISGGGVDITLNDSAIGDDSNASALSISQSNLDSDTTVAINNSALFGSTSIDAAVGNINFTADGSTFAGGIHIHETSAVTGADNEKTTRVAINDSTIDTTGVTTSADNYPLYVESDRGEVSVALNGDTIVQTGKHNDVTVSSGSGDNSGGDVNLTVADSQLSNGIAASTTNAGASSQVTVKNSSIAQNTASWGTAIVASTGEQDTASNGVGTATVAVDNSQINGDVAAESLGGGASAISLSGGAEVGGSLLAMGTDNRVDIDNATLGGDITFSTLHDDATTTTNNTVDFTGTDYGGNITSANENAVDTVTININNKAVIGGDSVQDAMQITGFDNVGVNINYLDPSLIDSGTAKYFYLDADEKASVQNGTSGVLAPLRSGSYIYDDIKYNVSDQSAAQSADLNGATYAVTFTDDSSKPTPSAHDLAADIQAARAGLQASDDMIHLVANGITLSLDQQMDMDVGSGDNDDLWLQGVYAGGDRSPGTTDYSNDISGALLGGEVARQLSNGDRFSVGASLGRLHNELDLNDRDGQNDIDGTYYSLWVGWRQPESDGGWRWFADSEFSWGDMSYSSEGRDGGIKAGGDYDGRSWLWQSRVGSRIDVVGDYCLQPSLTLGYVNSHTDGYYDGYSHIDSGSQDNGFTGAGLRLGTRWRFGQRQELRPWLEVGYIAQFGNNTDFATEDYRADSQNLNGGRIGIGIESTLIDGWSLAGSVDNWFGQGIDNEAHGRLTLGWRF